MVFDALDGYVARLAQRPAISGAELDSLCDMVTFGVAPAFLLVKMCPQFSFFHKRGGVGHCGVVRGLRRVAAGAVQRRDQRRRRPPDFQRPAQPGGGGGVAGFAIMFYTLRNEDNPLTYAAQIDIGAAVRACRSSPCLVALLMVSRIPYPHVVNQVFRGQRSFGTWSA